MMMIKFDDDLKLPVDRFDPRNDPSIKDGHIHLEGDNRVFVFGSNLLGIHGGGAAGYAWKKLGAEMGIAEGPTGNSYALPTCYQPGEPVTFAELIVYVENFLTFASRHPEAGFFVSPIGCGIAGFTEEEVGPLFLKAPSNCDLPPGWRGRGCEREGGDDPTIWDGKQCGANPTHMFRFEYVDGKYVHRGGTVLCQKHFDEDRHDNRSEIRNVADPAYVTL